MADTITPNTPTRRNRGGSPKQYAALERMNGTWTPELRERFYAVTQGKGSTFHERLRWLVEREEARQEGDAALEAIAALPYTPNRIPDYADDAMANVKRIARAALNHAI